MNTSQFEFLVAEFPDEYESPQAILKELDSLEEEIQLGIKDLKAMLG